MGAVRYGVVSLSAVLLSLTLTGADDECPVKFHPERVVVEFGSSVSVNCSTDVLHDGIGWEANEGSVSMTSTQNHTIWRVSSLRRWDSKPQCYILINRDQCERYLSITVYKTPDRVSISIVDLKGVMIEGSQYELQCDVVNVAPVQNLTVKWYKGEILVHRETFNDTIKSPLNKTSTLSITVDRTDDGVQYRCEAELELGAEGPQPPPKVTSKPLHIAALYSPKHKLTEEIISGDGREVTLNCTVDANPTAVYSWDSEHLKEKMTSSVLSSSTLSPGNYTCIALNSLGTSSKLFIVRTTGRGTFWAILLSGLAGLAIIILSYTIYKCTVSQNSVI